MIPDIGKRKKNTKQQKKAQKKTNVTIPKFYIFYRSLIPFVFYLLKKYTVFILYPPRHHSVSPYTVPDPHFTFMCGIRHHLPPCDTPLPLLIFPFSVYSLLKLPYIPTPHFKSHRSLKSPYPILSYFSSLSFLSLLIPMI
jgi:hypothetical protein